MNRFEIKRDGQRLAFKFNKRGQLFVGPDNEPLSVAGVRGEQQKGSTSLTRFE